MSDIPNSGGKRKPTKKKAFSLDDFKQKIGAPDVADRPLEWYLCSEAFRKETGLPGFPKGYVALARGFSNTGKSTSVCEAAVNAQKQGDLVIIIDTENNIGKDRLKLMGFDTTQNVIFIDNEYLFQQFGKARKEKVSEASIEDLADCISFFLDQQEEGNLPYNICFIIDSLGTLDCIRSILASDKGTSDNNMWNAGAFERAFKYITNNRIPNSRKEDKPYVNTIIAVQKIWLDAMGPGQPVVKHKGGEAYYYASRLIYHHGGKISHGTRKVTATSKKRDISYGIETKIEIEKNQIDGPLGGIAFQGKLISTPHGFISSDKEAIDEYKKQHISYFRDALGSDIDPEDIKTIFEDEEGGVSFDPETGEVDE